jgi:ribosomal-protein-alanine N-acetyltransferase
MTLEVATNNNGAQAFYQRLGYHAAGRIPGYYADGTDALVMRKLLNSTD